VYELFGKNILITGGTGQLGTFLVESLINNHANVIVLGRNKNRLKEIKSFNETKKIRFINCDLIDAQKIESISPIIKNTNYIIHLSSELSTLYTTMLDNAHYSIALNLKGIIRLLRHLPKLDGILYSSSIAVYGKPAYIPVDEDCPTNPISIYGCSKLGGEFFLKLFSNFNSLPLTILRYATIYGPRNRSNQAIPSFINSVLNDKDIELFGDGKEFRDFIYVSDAVTAALSAIKKNESVIYNIGSGDKCTIYELAKNIIEITNSKSKIIFTKKPKGYGIVCNISNAQRKLCFNPKVNLKEGLVNEIEWHRNKIE